MARTTIGSYNFPSHKARGLIRLGIDLYAKDAGKPSIVNVTAKAYRKLALYEPGTYEVTLSYKSKGKTEKTIAEWIVRDIASARKAKNLILFIGDGMTTNMITGMPLIVDLL